MFGAPEVALLNLPQLAEDQAAHRPFVAAHAVPWPGEMAVFRSAATDGFALLSTFGMRARMGILAADFYSLPTSCFDLGNALVIGLFSGTLESVTDVTLLGGANALAVRCRISSSRTRKTMAALCTSSLFTGTKRIDGRIAAASNHRAIIRDGTFNEGLDAGGRDQPHRVAELADLTAPEISAATSVHRDDAGRQLVEKLQHLHAAQFLA